MPVRYHWGHPGRNTESAWHSHRKELPGCVPKMKETGPVSTCERELLRGWRRPIGLMVSFMVFTASVWKILDPPTYDTASSQQYIITTLMLNQYNMFINSNFVESWLIQYKLHPLLWYGFCTYSNVSCKSLYRPVKSKFWKGKNSHTGM